MAVPMSRSAREIYRRGYRAGYRDALASVEREIRSERYGLPLVDRAHIAFSAILSYIDELRDVYDLRNSGR